MSELAQTSGESSTRGIAATFIEKTKGFFKLPEDPELRLKALAGLREECKRLYADLLLKSEAGDAEIWTALGHGAQHGWGVERNSGSAESWFRKGAAAGYPAAMVRLALLLSHPDRGGDRAEALEWLHEAAGRGNSSAMVQLGFASREAQGVDLDYKAAVEWFIKAHEAGDLHAAMHVGRTFASYMDQVSDALPWLLRAAKQSNRDSYIYLAMIHDERGSDHYEPAEAVKWYQTVVAKNGMSSPRALLALARHYRDGDGVPRSKEIAKVWLGMLIHGTSASDEFRREGEDLLHQMESDLI